MRTQSPDRCSGTRDRPSFRACGSPSARPAHQPLDFPPARSDAPREADPPEQHEVCHRCLLFGSATSSTGRRIGRWGRIPLHDPQLPAPSPPEDGSFHCWTLWFRRGREGLKSALPHERGVDRAPVTMRMRISNVSPLSGVTVSNVRTKSDGSRKAGITACSAFTCTLTRDLVGPARELAGEGYGP